MDSNTSNKEKRNYTISVLRKSMEQLNKELMKQFPNETELKVVYILIKTNLIPIKHFIKLWINTGRLELDKQYVKEKDDRFFTENPFFKEYPSIRKAFLENIWNSNQLDDNGKENIWKWQEIFLSLIEEYKKYMDK